MPFNYAPSYVHCSVADVLATAKEEKKRKYKAANEDCRALFSHYVVSVHGAMVQQGMRLFCFSTDWLGSCLLVEEELY